MPGVKVTGNQIKAMMARMILEGDIEKAEVEHHRLQGPIFKGCTICIVLNPIPIKYASGSAG